MTVWKFEFRPDGKQLAVSAQIDPDTPFDPDAPNAGLPAQPVRLVDAATLQDEPVQLGGIPENAGPSEPHYSVDGRFLAVSFDVTATAPQSPLGPRVGPGVTAAARCCSVERPDPLPESR